MRKLKIFIIATIALLLLSSPALAFDSDMITLNQVSSSAFYASTFDNKVLDFSLNLDSSDTLNAVSLVNNGTANDLYDISKMTLWLDEGIVGFQGMGIDKVLGNLVNRNFNEWYISGLNQEVASSSRFFVSIETSSNISSTKTVQMLIPQLSDINSNGQFDIGDKGIFLASGNNGPADQAVINNDSQTIYISSVDNFPPKMVITNLIDNQTIEPGSFTVTGLARDQGNSPIVLLNLIINNNEPISMDDWNSADYTWSYIWNVQEEGIYEIKTEAKDAAGKYILSSPITITVAKSAIQEPEEPQPTESPIPGINYGDLIKASRDSVYYYGADGKRYVFPDQKTYMTWYADFSGVKTITDEQLSSIQIGGNVTYKPGVRLVKITTDPKVYAVSANGILRWIESEAVAIALYGENWGSLVQDVADPFFTNYTTGESIDDINDYNPESESSVSSINQDLGLL